MAILIKFWHGQLPLVATFWLGWVLPLLAIYMVLSLAVLGMQKGGDSTIFTLTFVSALVAVVSSIAVWRSATTYAGPSLLKFAARAITLLGTAWQLFSFGVLTYVAVGMAQGVNATHDNDRVAEKTAISSKTYPMAGFWKTQSSDNFGLAISPTGVGKYSVSFCGPGGCFKPGTYRPDTPLVNDDDYQVINSNTLRVQGRDGWTTYRRAPCRQEPCSKENLISPQPQPS